MNRLRSMAGCELTCLIGYVQSLAADVIPARAFRLMSKVAGHYQTLDAVPDWLLGMPQDQVLLRAFDIQVAEDVINHINC